MEHAYPRGQARFHAGDPALSLHVIRSGRVHVFSRWRDGDEQVLRLLGPGEILGYRAVLAGESYNSSAEAVVDTRACIVPGETVREMLRANPELATQMLEKLARELRVSEELMMELVHRPVGQRMARMVGTTPETLSRTLRRLAQRGVPVVTRECIRIRDLERPRRAAGENAQAT